MKKVCFYTVLGSLIAIFWCVFLNHRMKVFQVDHMKATEEFVLNKVLEKATKIYPIKYPAVQIVYLFKKDNLLHTTLVRSDTKILVYNNLYYIPIAKPTTEQLLEWSNENNVTIVKSLDISSMSVSKKYIKTDDVKTIEELCVVNKEILYPMEEGASSLDCFKEYFVLVTSKPE